MRKAGTPLLRIEGLKKTYKKNPALRGIDLVVYPGETVVLMGPSGCGKSTLVRCINRLTEPEEGKVFFKGMDLMTLSYHQLCLVRREIGYVFQHFNLIKRLTVLDNVTFALRMYGIAGDLAESRGLTALSLVGLEGKASDLPEELSGGERQRVGIARALALEPKLMIWDEPTAALDPILIGEVIEVMEKVVKTKETTMIIVTHEVGFAHRAADRILLLSAGEIIEEGTPEEVLGAPKSAIGKKYRKLLKD